MRPSGQGFGYRIQEGNATDGIGGHDGVADASQRGCPALLALAQLALGLVLVQRHLDVRFQLALIERLEDKAERFGNFGAIDGRPIGVGGQVDHRHVAFPADALRRGDAVHLTREANIHQHQARTERGYQRQRLFARCGGAGDGIP